jgi:hypothetical protein
VAFLDEVMVQQIGREARQIRPGVVARKVALVLLAAVGWLLFGIGWTVRKTFVVGWLSLTWSWTAIRVGWQAGAPPKPKT